MNKIQEKISEKVKERINDDYFNKKTSKMKDKDVDKVVKFAKKILNLAENIPMVGRYVETIHWMVLLVIDYKKGIYRDIPFNSIAAIVFALLYFLSPIDLIPDYIPIIGYLDDIAVLELCLKFVNSDLENYIQFKQNQSENAQSSWLVRNRESIYDFGLSAYKKKLRVKRRK